jgi:DNA polymerase III alpha subunit
VLGPPLGGPARDSTDAARLTQEITGLDRADGSTGDSHVILLARDAAGYANLCRLITQAHMSGERGEPSLRPSEVMARAGGLVCLLGAESMPGRLARLGRPGAARELLRPWREAFGPWCFVELRNHLEQGSPVEIRSLLRLAGEADVPAVAANTVRYLVPEDAFVADALECMREIVPVAEHHVSRRNAEGWLKPPAAMRALFAERPDVCDATVRIGAARSSTGWTGSSKTFGGWGTRRTS